MAFLANSELEIWRWLSEPDGQQALARTEVMLGEQNELNVLDSLRRDFGNERAAAIIQQVQWRRRAADKFDDAHQMLFTPTGLAQATSNVIAKYKANRLREEPVWDLCCGIGGDLRALASRGTTVGIEIDPVTAFVAQFNVRQMDDGRATVTCEDVSKSNWPESALLHIDPDRRADGVRSVDVDHFSPSWNQIESMLQRAHGSSVKLAPATRVPDHWLTQGSREWIGHRGECKQQVLWTGALAEYGWLRAATVLSHGGDQIAQITSTHAGRQSIADGPLGRYLYEPHAAVLTAELVPELSHRLEARQFSRDVAYLTGENLERTLLAAAFEILDTVPMRAAAMEDTLQKLGLGFKELKTRGLAGVDLSAAKRIRADGPPELTIVLTRVASRPRALICRRCE